MFAGYIAIEHRIKCQINFQTIQDAIDWLSAWTEAWLIESNEAKFAGFASKTPRDKRN